MADFTQHTSHSSETTNYSSTSSDTMSMSMSMTFVVSTDTPLFSSSWTPHTLGQYAGTCIFLIVLAFAFRFVLAWKQTLEHRWARVDEGRKPIVVLRGKEEGGSEVDLPNDGAKAEGEKEAVKREGWSGRPWRFGTDLPRAAVTVVVTGMGYLL